MQATPESPLAFKFHWLDDKGNQVGMRRKAGSFDGATLKLDETAIPIGAILDVFVRENKMVLSAAKADGAATALFMPSSAAVAESLKKSIDIARSHVWAERHRDELVAKNRGQAFRSAACPHCGAVSILTGMPSTPQVYCQFCQTLSTSGGSAEPVAGEQHFRLCEQCGMYSKPRKFTIFYFYFLLVVYGFWSKSTWRCPGCMRGEAWKMFFGNLVFVLGAPVAIVQLFRAYGFTDISGPFKGLDRANLLARKGDFLRALEQYREIQSRAPNCAGLNYNLGLALLTQGEKQQAAEAFAVALADCANYTPAYQLLKGLYAELGEAQKLQALETRWGQPAAGSSTAAASP